MNWIKTAYCVIIHYIMITFNEQFELKYISKHSLLFDNMLKNNFGDMSTGISLKCIKNFGQLLCLFKNIKCGSFHCCTRFYSLQWITKSFIVKKVFHWKYEIRIKFILCLIKLIVKIVMAIKFSENNFGG